MQAPALRWTIERGSGFIIRGLSRFPFVHDPVILLEVLVNHAV
jgi:hypothetical protein